MKPHSVLFPVLTLTIWASTIWAERNLDMNLDDDEDAPAAAKKAALSGSGGSEEHAHRAAARTAPPEPTGEEGQMTSQVTREATGHVARHDALLQGGPTGCERLSKTIKWLKDTENKECLLNVKDTVGNPALLGKGFGAAGDSDLGHILKGIPGFQEAGIVKTVWSLAWNLAKLIETHVCKTKTMALCKEGHAATKVILAITSLLMVCGALSPLSPQSAFAVAIFSWIMTHGLTDFCMKVEEAYTKGNVNGLIEFVKDVMQDLANSLAAQFEDLKAFLKLPAQEKLNTVLFIVGNFFLGLASCTGRMIGEAVGALTDAASDTDMGRFLENHPFGPPVGPDFYYKMQDINVNCQPALAYIWCQRNTDTQEANLYPICSCYSSSLFNIQKYLCSETCFARVCPGKPPGCGCKSDSDGGCWLINAQGITHEK